jgi:hypothetical protein
MTVKELIEQLQQVENQDINVVIKGTDPTDWTYYNDIESTSFEHHTVEDEEGITILDDSDVEDYDKDEIKPLFIIDAGLF